MANQISRTGAKLRTYHWYLIRRIRRTWSRTEPPEEQVNATYSTMFFLCGGLEGGCAYGEAKMGVGSKISRSKGRLTVMGREMGIVEWEGRRYMYKDLSMRRLEMLF